MTFAFASIRRRPYNFKDSFEALIIMILMMMMMILMMMMPR